MTSEIKYSGFWRRFLAMFTDGFMLFMPNLYAIWFVSKSSTLVELLANAIQMLAIITLPMIFISAAYSIFSIHYFGTTIGKALAGIWIVRESGEKLSVKRALFRQTVGRKVSGALLGAGYWSLIKNPKKQTWHDQMVGSLAIVRGNWWPLALITLLIMLASTAFVGNSTIKNINSNLQLKQDVSVIFESLKEESKSTPDVNQIEEDTESTPSGKLQLI